ncbi:peptidase family M48-domain-containing protein [Xylaria cf. heliscus]|nr:peptidase family M48-domain-containing protein [Xylaria cf. heliscus]
MRALRTMPPARARASIWSLVAGRAPSPRIPRISSCPATVMPLSPLSRSPPLPASRLRRPFSHAAPRRNNWHDPRRHDPAEQLRRAKPLFTQQGASKLVRSPSLHTMVALSFAGGVAFYFMNIQTVPVSGRRRFNCYSEAKVKAAGEAQARHIEYEVERRGGRFLTDWDPRTQRVKKVMKRLIPVSGMADDEWEVKVIDEPGVANAFVLPGGKVFVYSGLIPVARNEHGLAAVLGHEIAHNLAEHTAERMSSQIGVNILLYSLITLSGGFLFGTYLGHNILDLVFSRPMGRLQEAEADYIGLMMMAEACYDPREALRFWERMKRIQQEEMPEWMSTHPSHDNRIQKIQGWLPQALDKLSESDCQGNARFANSFREALEKRYLMEPRHDI